MSLPTPNYVLTEDFIHRDFPREPITIPAGTFARPIELCYVPKHVIEDPKWQFFNKNTEVFCYTSYGFIAMPRSILRQK